LADFEGRTIFLGISGGIAAYKSCELARLLVKRGARVKVVMTDAACKFVGPLTFRTLTGNPVATSLWSDPSSPFPHISLSEEAEIIVVAPATANVIAKFSRGIADDLLSTTLISARGKIIIAPAMNERMYRNPVTQENISNLREKGVVIVEPGVGDLACGEEGVGRMAEPSQILNVIERELERIQSLRGVKVLVTAGPTREHIDPVRFLSNPSTGRMGYAVAEEASKRGAEVVLVSGPTFLPCPPGVRKIDVVSALEMKDAVLENLGKVSVVIMAAAVADFRPRNFYQSKIKKRDGLELLELERTEDIIESIREVPGSRILVGFAAETDDVIANAKKKLKEKGLDLVVANDVSAPSSGFAAEMNLAAIIGSHEEEVELRHLSKFELSGMILDRVSELLAERGFEFSD